MKKILTVLAGLWVLSRVWTTQFREPIHLHERAVFFYSLGALLLGGQLISLGFLAELITAFSGRDADTYSVLEQTGDALDDKPIHEDLAEQQPATRGDDSSAGEA